MPREQPTKPNIIPPVMRIMQAGEKLRPIPVGRYTLFVRWSKMSLWGLVAIMVGIVIWIGSGKSGVGVPRVVVSSTPHVDSLQNIMVKPRYQGLDVHNQPYTITADKATQKDKDTVVMENLHADLMRSNGTWLGLNAAQGEMNIQTKMMQLTGGVAMFADGGYEFRTDHAQVDIQKASAYGDSHIEGQGPPGTLQADGFSMDNKEHVIHFNGSVKMVLFR